MNESHIDTGAIRVAYEEARLEIARMHATSGESLRTVFQGVAELVTRTLGVDRVGIWLLVDDRRAARCYHLYQRSHRDVYEGAVLHAQDFPAYFQALDSRRVIPVSEALTDPITAELRTPYLEPLGITSLLDAPIFRGGQVVGVVCNEHTGEPREWTQQDCDFVVSVAEVISRLFEETARQQAETSLGAYQAHLMEMHRMEALGRLAAGVAHDFRNILTVMLGQGSVIADTPGITPNVAEAAHEIIEAAKIGDRMTQELLTFGKESPDAPKVLDLKETLQALCTVLQLSVGKTSRLTLQCSDGVSRVFIDPSQFERAILNLVLNARDAMPKGGDLEVRLEEVAVQEGRGIDGKYVCVAVRDAGIGMDEDTRKRIFDPFFTTKGDKGTGLGLAIVHQIVHRAGGFLRVDSEPGRGTTIRMYLPRIGRKA